jgi:hypothetical protein
MKLTKRKRELLRMKFGGCCAYCGTELPSRGWHAVTLDPELRLSDNLTDYSGGEHSNIPSTSEVYSKGDELANLAPSCEECSLLKSSYTLEMFRQHISQQAQRARRHSANFRAAERFGLVREIPLQIVFWFEKYQSNQSIRQRAPAHLQDSAA